MNNDVITTARRGRGRPPNHLLSVIAVCGVCGAGLRMGSQNRGRRRYGSTTDPLPRYRVYECVGGHDAKAAHTSISQEHLDQIVIDAVLAEIGTAGFRVPRSRQDADPDGVNRRALKREISRDQKWLAEVRQEAIATERPHVLAGQERIVLPKIEAARKELASLEELNPLIDALRQSHARREHWDSLTLSQQRDVIAALVVPVVNPVSTNDRGRPGPNVSRVKLVWR